MMCLDPLICQGLSWFSVIFPHFKGFCKFNWNSTFWPPKPTEFLYKMHLKEAYYWTIKAYVTMSFWLYIWANSI